MIGFGSRSSCIVENILTLEDFWHYSGKIPTPQNLYGKEVFTLKGFFVGPLARKKPNSGSFVSYEDKLSPET